MMMMMALWTNKTPVSNVVGRVHRLESSPFTRSLVPPDRRKKEDNAKAQSRCYSTTTGRELPPFQELGMPALSPTMTTGGIASWRVVEGQRVVAGDVLAEI